MTASEDLKRLYRKKGFTLLEVMISISIIALIFLALFRMQSGTIALATSGKFNSMAPLLARQLLVKIDQDPAGWSQVKGDFGENFAGVEWTCTIQDAAFEELDFITRENQDRFKKIEIEIISPSGSRFYSVNTWRFLNE